jgi:hypothetical protein
VAGLGVLKPHQAQVLLLAQPWLQTMNLMGIPSDSQVLLAVFEQTERLSVPFVVLG